MTLAPISLITQLHSCGCSVASVAMIVGISYQEMIDRFNLKNKDLETDGFSCFQWDHWLAELEWSVQRFYITDCRQEDNIIWPPNPWASRHLCEVRAIEGADCIHLVVMDENGIVFDPLGKICKLKDYPRVYNVTACYKVTKPRFKI